MFGAYALGSIFVTMFGSTRWYQFSMPPPNPRSSHPLAICGMCDQPDLMGRMIGAFFACWLCVHKDSNEADTDEGRDPNWLDKLGHRLAERSKDNNPLNGKAGMFEHFSEFLKNIKLQMLVNEAHPRGGGGETKGKQGREDIRLYVGSF